MKQIIDIENWERKENFNFFRHFQNPQLSITSEVECGGAKQRAKAAGQSFFLHYLYAVLRAANEIPEFRYRIDTEGRVVLYDTIDMLSPIKIKENGKFFTTRFPYHNDFDTFYREAKMIIEAIPEDGDPYASYIDMLYIPASLCIICSTGNQPIHSCQPTPNHRKRNLLVGRSDAASFCHSCITAGRNRYETG